MLAPSPQARPVILLPLRWYDVGMSKAIKVAISLPEEVAIAADAARRARGESRSAFFRRAAQTVLREEHEKLAVAAYVRGYECDPESDEEIAGALNAGIAGLAAEPFD